MDYNKFENEYQRTNNALDLKKIILKNQSLLFEIPNISDIKKSLPKWLPEGLYTCLDSESDDCKDSEDCPKRCSWKYWRDHSFEVASLMKEIAEILNEDTKKWELAGLVHDFDYLKFPHHIANVDSNHAHPVEICRWLFKNKISFDICLAVLEHAPHLGLTPSSKMSYALIACDEFATMTGSNYFPEIPINVNPTIKELLHKRNPSMKFEGFKRDDMQKRFNNALISIS